MTETTVRIVIFNSRFDLKIWEIKPVRDEKVAIKEDVPTHIFGSSPIIKREGTMKEPPPRPISPTRKPKIPPIQNPAISFPFYD